MSLSSPSKESTCERGSEGQRPTVRSVAHSRDILFQPHSLPGQGLLCGRE